MENKLQKFERRLASCETKPVVNRTSSQQIEEVTGKIMLDHEE